MKKRFIAWLAVFVGYVIFLYLFSTLEVVTVVGSVTEVVSGGSAQPVPLGELVQVKVTRANGSYWFGLISVPRYILNDIYIDSYNALFFNSMFVALVALVGWELISMAKKPKTTAKLSESHEKNVMEVE